MASLLDKIKSEMLAKNIQPRTDTARSWLVSKISSLTIPSNRSNVLNDASRIAAKAFIGRMYIYHYDPKYKDVLPVWDKFPLVIPMEMYQDGFLGLNLHYLDPMARLVLLDRLMDFINNNKYNDTTVLNLSYDLLKGVRRYKLFEQCVKRYLISHIRSSIIYIEPYHWETACFLPVQKMVYKV